MNQITGDPNNYDFGMDFDYAVWTANTNITLTNVPWNNDYRDVVSFATTNDLNAYIDSSVSQNVTIANSMYAKANEPIVLEIPFNVANRFNYVRVYNPAQPLIRGGGDSPKYFYYFITDVRYSAPNATTIIVQLDVFQTYIRQVRFGRCYVERGHLGIANSENFRNYGRDYLTVPEGLDTGENYITVMQKSESQLVIPAAGKYSILVASTVKLEADPGTVGSPKLVSAEGGVAQGLPSGASYYIFLKASEFTAFMRKYSDKPWVTQGIISITVIPEITRYYQLSELGAKLPIGAYKAPSVAARKAKSVQMQDWRNNTRLRNYIPPRYRHLKKFYTFPYMAIELSTMVGQSSIHKPELINSPDIIVKEEVALLPPNQRISWWLDGYNSVTPAMSDPAGQMLGLGYDHAVSLGNFPALAIVNNGAILAMANSAHTTAFGYQSADWSQQRALRSNEVSYDQASMGINAASDQARIAGNSDIASTGISNQLAQDSAMFNLIGGTASGAGMGAFAGPAGAIAGGIGGAASGVMGLMSTGMQVDAANAQLANRLSAASQSQGVSSGLASGIRDTNKSLADWAARGDYESTISGLNARTRDMQLTPPSVIGQQGGETLGMLNFRYGYRLGFLMPDQASIQTVGEIWLRYGYAVQRFAFIPNDLMVMDKFTYWKMKETYIRSAGMPETFKQALRGILEKGVTVWANPDDIGVIDPAINRPLPGITIDGYEPPIPDPDPDPEPPAVKKRNNKMLVYSTIDTNPATAGNVWALAGTSPGTDANWIETRDSVRAVAFMEACQVDTPVGITESEFAEYRDLYRSPLGTQEIPPTPEG